MYLRQEANLNDLDKLIVLRSYLYSHGLVKEAGAIDDLIDGVRDKATVIWDENKALAAKILFIAQIRGRRLYFLYCKAGRLAVGNFQGTLSGN